MQKKKQKKKEKKHVFSKCKAFNNELIINL